MVFLYANESCEKAALPQTLKMTKKDVTKVVSHPFSFSLILYQTNGHPHPLVQERYNHVHSIFHLEKLYRYQYPRSFNASIAMIADPPVVNIGSTTNN